MKMNKSEKISKWFTDTVQVIYGAWTTNELKETISRNELVLVTDDFKAYVRKKGGYTVADVPLSSFD